MGMGRVAIFLQSGSGCHKGEGEIEGQVYVERWDLSMLTLRCHV